MNPLAVERTVDADGTAIATVDHGGQGRPILLLHGAGGSASDWLPVVPALLSHHRVVAMDLRGHGRSGDGPWQWDLVVDDVRAVLESFGWTDAAVVGYSLGGMVAAMLAVDGGIAAAVNVDGHGAGRPEHIAGTAPDVAAGRIGAYQKLVENLLAAMGPVTADDLLEQERQLETAARISPDVARTLVRRRYRSGGEQRWQPRPASEYLVSVVRSVAELDLLDVYRSTRVPLLVMNAVAPDVDVPNAPEWMPGHLAAYRSGLSWSLRRLSQECDLVETVDVDATHALLLEIPGEVARLVEGFLSAPRTAPVTEAGALVGRSDRRLTAYDRR
jgi:pimeloyl-ACP methyl ester carboxylesterase